MPGKVPKKVNIVTGNRPGVVHSGRHSLDDADANVRVVFSV
jgi:hypothetical protein